MKTNRCNICGFEYLEKNLHTYTMPFGDHYVCRTCDEKEPMEVDKRIEEKKEIKNQTIGLSCSCDNSLEELESKKAEIDDIISDIEEEIDKINKEKKLSNFQHGNVFAYKNIIKTLNKIFNNDTI